MAVIDMLSQQETLRELSKNLTTWKEQYGVKIVIHFIHLEAPKRTALISY